MTAASARDVERVTGRRQQMLVIAEPRSWGRHYSVCNERAIAWPATHADDQAHWKLKPPSRPSTSRISPTRYNPAHLRDSIVAWSTSASGIPPAVTSA